LKSAVSGFLVAKYIEGKIKLYHNIAVCLLFQQINNSYFKIFINSNFYNIVKGKLHGIPDAWYLAETYHKKCFDSASVGACFSFFENHI